MTFTYNYLHRIILSYVLVWFLSYTLTSFLISEALLASQITCVWQPPILGRLLYSPRNHMGTIKRVDVSECKENCQQLDGCLSFVYIGSLGGRCRLYDVTKSDVPLSVSLQHEYHEMKCEQGAVYITYGFTEYVTYICA